MRVGTIAYATEQGLGRLAKAFYDNGVVTDVLVVEHHCRPTHYEWYPNQPHTSSRRFDCRLAEEFVRQLDVLLVFETPFDWQLLQCARGHGVRTVLMPMYECTPERLPVLPDKFICPSLLDEYYFRKYANCVFLPVPVDVKWRRRDHATLFVHNAGNGGLHGRNGTAELLQAMQYVKNPAVRLLVRSQVSLSVPSHPQVTYQEGTLPYEELWEAGDVFVFPEKFNGLSLPLQEAHAAGMLVMCGNRFPMNTWLPQHPLIPVSGYTHDRIGGCIPFKSAVIDPQAIATQMDLWAGRSITDYSLQGRQWAAEHSWEVLKPRYLKELQ